ncbi:MAG TPA: S8 family serine peptidase, partial [Acidobacteriota bacterium]|nr:S8 family serine peptidase [Acidobacteriota bacterium]
WLDALHEEGRQAFYRTVRDEIGAHPKLSLLTGPEVEKIRDAETRTPRLYEILINIFYQKDEPVFSELLRKDDKASRSRFSRMYLDLARFSGHMFVEAFFATDPINDRLRETFPAYKGLDAVDLVIRSVGYNAKLDPAPPHDRFKNPVSPEFERQGALDAATFREAHKITRGKGAKIAILDTGIDETHSIFKNTEWGPNFSLVGRTGKPWATDASLVDWGWHGTLISSVAAVYAPEARLTMYKMLDGDTQNDPVYQLLLECIVAANIYRAVHDGNDIISISASGANLDLGYLKEACRYTYDKNRVLVSGALYSRWFKQGNTRNFPGQYETVVSVTAAQKKPDGSYGYWDVCAAQDTNTVAAPNDIFGAFPTFVGKEDAYIPSISAAIPVVSSLFALLVSVDPPRGDEAPGEYARSLMDLVSQNASPERVGFKGFSPECGHGLIDAEKSVKAALELAGRRK